MNTKQMQVSYNLDNIDKIKEATKRNFENNQLAAIYWQEAEIREKVNESVRNGNYSITIYFDRKIDQALKERLILYGYNIAEIETNTSTYPFAYTISWEN